MPTATAKVSGKVIASADTYETVEGNVYFPPSAIDKSLFSDSDTHSVCPWKGTASYYDLTVDGKTLKDAAWYYPDPKDKAKNIKDHVAFCEYTCSLSDRESSHGIATR
ncbi:hypothetical protein PV08_10073 [Exophiala spinifera]|uniref:DUF427 domain-containing protein n=1 Tax=Exophiala spinifera TaxID=91928 RepID=A0A0D2BHD8_9EURO|nr:uncharacterized protein PV08_10073 [Exophiala spinifera]KIW10774.1 hypothetical protein PV08_10073 [Exophiala spinifera]